MTHSTNVLKFVLFQYEKCLNYIHRSWDVVWIATEFKRQLCIKYKVGLGLEVRSLGLGIVGLYLEALSVTDCLKHMLNR